MFKSTTGAVDGGLGGRLDVRRGEERRPVAGLRGVADSLVFAGSTCTGPVGNVIAGSTTGSVLGPPRSGRPGEVDIMAIAVTLATTTAAAAMPIRRRRSDDSRGKCAPGAARGKGGGTR